MAIKLWEISTVDSCEGKLYLPSCASPSHEIKDVTWLLWSEALRLAFEIELFHRPLQDVKARKSTHTPTIERQ